MSADRRGRREPMPSWVDPELATLTKDRFSDPNWIFERKLDGERCLAFRDSSGVRLMTRNKKLISSNYPELVAALTSQPGLDFVADGEIVAFDGEQTSFARLQQRMPIAEPDPDLVREVGVSYFLFDLMYLDGRDLRGLPLRDRKDLLRELITFGGPLRYTEHRDTGGLAAYQEACRLGWEGVVAKRADGPYRAGRSKDWLKFKCETSQEFVIGGFTDPQGTRIRFGALLLGYYDGDGRLVYAGKVGTGFTTNVLDSVHAKLAKLEQEKMPFDAGTDLPRVRVHWTKPRLVGQVGFSEWTTAGQLRHPRFLGLRDDKDPADIVREGPVPAGPEG
ncbi:MAG: non-homologous end-joining DNA ligase [Actinomycetota bacterium]